MAPQAQPSEAPASSEIMTQINSVLTSDEQKVINEVLVKNRISLVTQESLNKLYEELPKVFGGSAISQKLRAAFPPAVSRVAASQPPVVPAPPPIDGDATSSWWNKSSWSPRNWWSQNKPETLKNADKMSGGNTAANIAISAAAAAGVSGAATIMKFSQTVQEVKTGKGMLEKLWEWFTADDWSRSEFFFSLDFWGFKNWKHMGTLVQSWYRDPNDDEIQNFCKLLKVPQDGLKYAKSLFNTENIQDVSFITIEKELKTYQDDPSYDLLGALKVKGGTKEDLVEILKLLISQKEEIKKIAGDSDLGLKAYTLEMIIMCAPKTN